MCRPALNGPVQWTSAAHLKDAGGVDDATDELIWQPAASEGEGSSSLWWRSKLQPQSLQVAQPCFPSNIHCCALYGAHMHVLPKLVCRAL